MSEIQFNDEDLLRQLKDKVVIVTGGNSGIGRACVEYFSAGGAKVIWGDLKNSMGEEGPDITYSRCDITDWDEQVHLFEIAVGKYGRVDSVIACAGIGEPYDIFKDEVDANGKLLPPKSSVIDIDLTGTIKTLKLAMHHFRKQSPQGGDISMIGSLASYRGTPGLYTYCAAKHGLLGITRASHSQAASINSRINLICPYMTRTGLVTAAVEEACRGVPIQPAVALARAAAVFSTEKRYNGNGCIVGNSRVFEIEDWMEKNQKEWMGDFMVDLLKIRPAVDASVWNFDSI